MKCSIFCINWRNLLPRSRPLPKMKSLDRISYALLRSFHIKRRHRRECLLLSREKKERCKLVALWWRKQNSWQKSRTPALAKFMDAFCTMASDSMPFPCNYMTGNMQKSKRANVFFASLVFVLCSYRCTERMHVHCVYKWVVWDTYFRWNGTIKAKYSESFPCLRCEDNTAYEHCVIPLADCSYSNAALIKGPSECLSIADYEKALESRLLCSIFRSIESLVEIFAEIFFEHVLFTLDARIVQFGRVCTG